MPEKCPDVEAGSYWCVVYSLCNTALSKGDIGDRNHIFLLFRVSNASRQIQCVCQVKRHLPEDGDGLSVLSPVGHTAHCVKHTYTWHSRRNRWEACKVSERGAP